MEALWPLVLTLGFLLLPLIGLARQRARLAALREELRGLEERLALLETGGTAKPSPAPPAPGPAATSAVPAAAPSSPVAIAPLPAASFTAPGAPPAPAPAAGPTAIPVAAAGEPPRPGASRPPSPAATPLGSDAAGLEQLLGTRLFVWIGAVALALAGSFLVRYAVERGWLGPAVRVLLTLLLGLLLLAAGERLRRSPRIGAGLSAAGIASLLAAAYGASALYGLIPPSAGFLCLGAVALGGLALALRQGPLVAVVGLLGGYLTPWLVRPDTDPSPWLFGYLLLLLLATLGLARLRGWWGLSAAALTAGLLWALVWWDAAGDARILWPEAFVLASSLAYLGLALGRARPGPAAAELPLRWVSAGGPLAQAILTLASGALPRDWLVFGIHGALVLILARRREHLLGQAWLAAGLSGLALLAWGGMDSASDRALELWIHVGLGALYGLGAWLAIRGSERAPNWAGLAAASVVGAFLLAYGARPQEATDRPYGLAALCLALLLVLAAAPVLRRGAELRGAPDAAAHLGWGAAALLFVAVGLLLRPEAYAAAWALVLTLAIGLGQRLSLPRLSWAAWPLAAAVALRLLNPTVLDFQVGVSRLMSGLWPVYGLPVLALLLGRRDAARQGQGELAAALGGLALLLLFGGSSLLVRQAFHPGAMAEPGLLPAENYGYSLTWVLLGAGLLGLGLWRREPLARWASLLVLLLAVGKVFLFDAASLGGLYRVLSFLGLGLSLIGLGWIYQRYVFRQPESGEPS